MVKYYVTKRLADRVGTPLQRGTLGVMIPTDGKGGMAMVTFEEMLQECAEVAESEGRDLEAAKAFAVMMQGAAQVIQQGVGQIAAQQKADKEAASAPVVEAPLLDESTPAEQSDQPPESEDESPESEERDD